jgi:hypothetical protein
METALISGTCSRYPETMGKWWSGLFVLLCTTSAWGESKARTHDGFYVQLAIGPSRSQDDYEVTGTGLFGDSSGKATGFGEGHQVAVGGALFPGFVLAGAAVADVAFSTKIENEGEAVSSDDSFGMVSFGPLLDFYPQPSGGFHVQAGFGFGIASGIAPEGVDGGGAAGIGFFGGVGYELWIADEWGVGGLLRLHHVRAQESADTLIAGKLDIEHRALAVALMFSATYN